MTEQSEKYERIYSMVYQIPRGKVSTYGDIATFAGLLRSARLVGHVLQGLPEDTKLPWHRVINSQGGISLGKVYLDGEQFQRYLLEQEGIIFNANGKVSLKKYRWQPF